MENSKDDGKQGIEFRIKGAQEPILVLQDDGKIIWLGREVTTDKQLVDGLRDVLDNFTGSIPTAPPFKDCRRYMANTLKCDKGLRLSYEANVAMLLHDRHGITDHDKRNAAAKDILHLVFES